MIKTIFVLLGILIVTAGNGQHNLRSLEDLVKTKVPAWPFVKQMIDTATNKVEVLPIDSSRAKDALYKTQVTTQSPMKQKNFWLRALNVRPEEGWLVKKLYWLQFLQGAGIAFFFTASFAQFLAHNPIKELPIVFIYSSLLLWIGGFVYSKMEHKFSITNLALIITIFIIASMVEAGCP